MPMTEEQNAYAEALSEKRILYMPSCVVVEMMTKLYSDIFAIDFAGPGALNRAVPEIVALLRKMTTNLRVTADAYNRSHIRFFIGDWTTGGDKLRARAMFRNIMERLGSIERMVGEAGRMMLYGAIEEMTPAWIALDRVMDSKVTEVREARARKKSGKTGGWSHFRNRHPKNWKRAMAHVLRMLHQDAEHGEGEYLVLLCFEQIKQQLLGAIKEIEQENTEENRRMRKFDPDCILAISQENVSFTCATCLELIDSIGKQSLDEEYPAASFAEAILAVQGASCPMRPPNQIEKKDMLPDKEQKNPKPPKKKKHTTMQWLRAALWRG